jgi:two-component system, chemotaxis family, sensor kinase CheA
MDLLILIVDDELLVANSLKRLIDNYIGCQVILHVNPVKALEIPELLEKKVDLIIADFTMPEMRGDTFLALTKSKCPNAIRILLTDPKHKDSMIDGKQTDGLFRCVEKPWDNNEMLTVIKEGIERVRIHKEVEKRNQELIIWNQTLEKRVKSRVASIKNLLDNANEGFLMVKEDLHVGDEFSKQCLDIFQTDISEQRFSKLLYPKNQEEQEFVDDLLTKAFFEKSKLKVEAFLSLLPSFLEYNQKQLELEYKLVEDPENEGKEAIMVIIEDITDKVILKNTIDEERRRLKMVVGAIVDSRSFFETVEGFKNFFSEGIFILAEKKYSAKDFLNQVYMSVHTFKGVFALKEMHGMVKELHQLENELSELQDGKYAFSSQDIVALLQRKDPIRWLDSDVKVLKEVLGEGYFIKKDLVEVRKDALEVLEKSILSLGNEKDKKHLTEKLKFLTYAPLFKMVQGYVDYCQKLASQMGKMIQDFSVEGGKVFVDPEMYRDFIKALGHIFRNILEYGIENPEERIEHGKPELGKIRFRIKEENEDLLFLIADDGAGIDMMKLKKKALEIGQKTKEELSNMTEQEILQLIFEPGFSTKDEVSEISGRGVGLFAVKEEVKRLHGEIEVLTQKGMGTVFKIKIPKK